MFEWLKRLFKLGMVKSEEEKKEYKIISSNPLVYDFEYSEIPINLELDVITVITPWVAYEDEEYDLGMQFRIVYPGTDAVALTRHPKGYMTGVYPFKMMYTVKVYGIEPPYEEKILFATKGIIEKFYDIATGDVKEKVISDKFVIQRFMNPEETHPAKFAVDYSWESFKVPFVWYPPAVGGDNKFHPAVVNSGSCKRARIFQILPYTKRPWYRK